MPRPTPPAPSRAVGVRRPGTAWVAIVSLALLAACGAKKEGTASQVAAKVDKQEISVHQINFMLQQQRGLKPEQVDTASRQVLERLIDQEIAVQQAVEGKLDRDPRVVQAMEAARREVLSRAWLERQGDAATKPTPQEIDAYYAAKPALFKERRVYSFAEFTIQAAPEAVAGLQATLDKSRGAQAFADALKAAGLAFNTTSGSRPAENIPMELLDRVASLAEGQGLVVAQPGGARALVLTRAVPAPVTAEQARPAIEQFLWNDAKRKKVEADMKALRATTKVQYVGKFAEAAASAPAGAAAPAAPAASTALDADAVNKGLQLK